MVSAIQSADALELVKLTLRHLAATMLAELRVPEALRKETMGHKEIRTTQIYTHLRPVHQVEPLEQLSDATPLADLFARSRGHDTRFVEDAVLSQAGQSLNDHLAWRSAALTE